jgi:phosphoglycerol transferase MdoB-like AlkP superfamily enzyme
MIEGIAVERLSRWSKISLTLIAFLVIVATLRYHEGIASPQMVVSSLFYKLETNIDASIEAHRDVVALRNTALNQAYHYSGYSLNHKPDIYLIFVESYGSVLYKRQDYREAYTSLLAQLQRQLYQDGWHAASALSEAPVWGGGSWMSYTSALFGIRIDTHPQFLSLLDKYQTVNYPDLGHYLKSQGYEYVRLSSLSDELKEEEQLKYKTFYGVDRWLRYRDLNYQGPNYGWGPAPPDQYSLNFAQDTIASDGETPVFFFFITQNSHYPWLPLPTITDDWRTLNAKTAPSPSPPPEPIPHEVRRANYMDAIEYQLRFLTDFILKTGDDDSVFVLIGDHQPQRVSRQSDGFETPIHIISKDAAFVDAFLDYDFVKGLEINEITPTMRHEGFYSMFVRVLLAQYGRGIKALPDYLPSGITLNDGTNTEEM